MPQTAVPEMILVVIFFLGLGNVPAFAQVSGMEASVSSAAPSIPVSGGIASLAAAGTSTTQASSTGSQGASSSTEPVDSEARAVIGFEQAGASAASAEQHFFFDFFIDRKMKHDALSLWGNVRVASYPQQIDTPVAQFASNFATNVGNLKVNQLAETAEFSTGLDWHPAMLRWPVGSNALRRLGFIFSVGAKGPFVPKSRLSLFQVPSTSSPQYPRFAAQFPSAAQSTYVGFIPPDRDRFYRSYGAGIRFTTQYRGDSGASRAPATYTVLFGQDENVTGGTFKGAVAKIDVFYPLPLETKGTRFLFLFGNADLRLSRAENTTPFVLNAAPASITGAEPSVAIIATPSNRDVYRIGVGVDAVALICAMGGKC